MEYKKDTDVIGIGVSTLDILMTVDRFPDREEVQKSLSSKIEGGGPVATAIVTLARLGANTIMLDSIGDDWIGSLILKEYKTEKVNSQHIKIHNGLTSSLAAILVRSNDGARTITYSPGNSPELNEDDIPIELISRAKYIHLNGRHFSACLKACQISKEYNTLVSFDGGASRFREELKELVPLTDICIVSREFAEKYTKQKEINKSGEKLLNIGPRIVIITDGINGNWLFTDKIDGYYQKAFIIKDTVDTTGCGDSFHGAFLFGLCKGYSLYESMSIASGVAALNTRKLGGRSALPGFSELEKFLKEVKL